MTTQQLLQSMAETAREPMAAWVLAYLLHSTLFLGGTWLVVRLRLVRNERLQEWFWRGALGAGLVSATLTVALAAVAPTARTIVPTNPTPVAVVPVREGWDSPEPQVFEDSAPAPSMAAAIDHPQAEPEPAPVSAKTAASPMLNLSALVAPGGAGSLLLALVPGGVHAFGDVARFEAPSRATLVMAALVLWVAGLAYGLVRLSMARGRLASVLRGRDEVKTGQVRRLLDGLCQRAGITRRIRLTVSDRVSTPLALGLSEICVPRRALLDLSRTEQEALLAHELGHLVRRDPLWLAAAVAIEHLFPFQPLNRVARRRLAELAEFLVDDWAAERLGSGLPLARCLMIVSQWFTPDNSPEAVPAMTNPNASPIVRRIERLLADERSRSAAPSLWQILTPIGAMVALAVAIPAFTTATRPAAAEPAPAAAPDPVAPAPAEVPGDAPEFPAADAPSDAVVPMAPLAPAVSGTARVYPARAWAVAPLAASRGRQFNRLNRGLVLAPHADAALAMAPVAPVAPIAPLAPIAPGEPILLADAGPTVIRLSRNDARTTSTAGYLGIGVDSPDGVVARQLNLDREKASVIDDVVEGSAAEVSGLEQYDIIVAINGNADAGPNAVSEAIRSTKPGETITFTVLRAGERKDVTAKVASRPRYETSGVRVFNAAEWNEFNRGFEDMNRDFAQGFAEFEKGFEGFEEAFEKGFEGFEDSFRDGFDSAWGGLSEADRERVRAEVEEARREVQRAREEARRAMEQARRDRDTDVREAEREMREAMEQARRDMIEAEREVREALEEARRETGKASEQSGEIRQSLLAEYVRKAVADAVTAKSLSAPEQADEVAAAVGKSAEKIASELEYNSNSVNIKDGRVTVRLKGAPRDADAIIFAAMHDALDAEGVEMTDARKETLRAASKRLARTLDSVELKGER